MTAAALPPWTRRIAASLGLAAAVAAPLAPAAAQDERPRKAASVTMPLPPIRPADLPGSADTTASIPRPAAAPAPVRTAAVELPHALPAAPRARMHACGVEWQQMKMSGAAADKTWRGFAQSCLISQDP